MSLLDNCKHTGFIDYDEMEKVPESVKTRLEEYLNRRMREETDNRFKKNIKLEKTDCVFEVWETENGETLYEYLSDCDEYVFCAELIVSPTEIEERDFGTSLSEWLG